MRCLQIFNCGHTKCYSCQNLLENAVRILPSLAHISSMLKFEWHGQSMKTPSIENWSRISIQLHFFASLPNTNIFKPPRSFSWSFHQIANLFSWNSWDTERDGRRKLVVYTSVKNQVTVNFLKKLKVNWKWNEETIFPLNRFKR